MTPLPYNHLYTQKKKQAIVSFFVHFFLKVHKVFTFLVYCTKTLRVGLLYSKYSYYFACHHSYDGFFLLYLICHFIMKGLINYEYKIYK